MAKSGTHCLGFETIRWQSKKASGRFFLRDLTMGAPRVKFGTKWPSFQAEVARARARRKEEKGRGQPIGTWHGIACGLVFHPTGWDSPPPSQRE